MKTKTCYRILGIMSGTSLDGVDFADCKFSKGKSWHYEIKKTQTIAYSKKWRERLSNLHKKSDKEIDKTNILYATFTSMQRALGQCKQQPDKALIDGKPLPNQIIPNEGIIKGDAFVPSIQAASIIAKVTRDKFIIELGKIFPEYGFLYHKGYGTKQHFEAIKNHKSSIIHRKSFNPINKHLASLDYYIRNNITDSFLIQIAGDYLIRNNHQIMKVQGLCIYSENKDICYISSINSNIQDDLENKIIDFSGFKKQVINIKFKNGVHNISTNSI